MAFTTAEPHRQNLKCGKDHSKEHGNRHDNPCHHQVIIHLTYLAPCRLDMLSEKSDASPARASIAPWRSLAQPLPKWSEPPNFGRLFH